MTRLVWTALDLADTAAELQQSFSIVPRSGLTWIEQPSLALERFKLLGRPEQLQLE